MKKMTLEEFNNAIQQENDKLLKALDVYNNNIKEITSVEIEVEDVENITEVKKSSGVVDSILQYLNISNQ